MGQSICPACTFVGCGDEWTTLPYEGVTSKDAIVSLAPSIDGIGSLAKHIMTVGRLFHEGLQQLKFKVLLNTYIYD